MAVYVDDMRAPYGQMIMCHMAADTTGELLAMADKIGVSRRWLQEAGTWKEHFDICLSKRAKAVKLGAVEVTRKDLARKIMQRRAALRHDGGRLTRHARHP